ncbi:DUF445 family protein [Siminovitchia acidinfaciens]|uniref:DUF445 family protein n=1 Tax=Siminovitchia acidinfaciens TaxID=2321395 RepID=A0A429Y1R8_9BACI|nr:DUF445 family protein [Siminovitchia acidinfaciens]RST75154.1 DUF445 family protein [Siminovitchia acidinfaciens]
MSSWFTIIPFMVIIGAVIGGFTNFLAIRMLFRPYRTLYLGKWQVPFTPGLIPKRQGELAAQIGKLVVGYLVTPESIYKKLTDDTFKRETEEWINAKLNTWLEKGMTSEEILERFGINKPAERMNAAIHKTIDKKYAELKMRYLDKSIGDILPDQLTDTIYSKIPGMADHMIQKGADYFSSDEGKEKIRVMIENFLKNRGKLWNLVQMFIGEDQLADKLQPEIMKFLYNKGTRDLLISILEEEGRKLEQRKLSEFYSSINEDRVLQFIKEGSADLFPLEGYLRKPVKELIEPYRIKLLDTAVPRLLAAGGDYLTKQSGEILERFQVEDIVRKEIESFSLERLEELVISVAKKELVMITYLGALLGGLIGMIQGIIVMLTS